MVPTLAATTMTIAISVTACSCWPSTSTPASAATAGSRLISSPNAAALSRRSAISSSEYGMIDESSATASPPASTDGRSRAEPPCTRPAGSVTTAPMHSAIASPSSWAKVAPTRLDTRM